MPSPVPEKILRLARAVRDAGGRALMVGGCVRDRLMGRDAKDWDVEVYGVEPSDLRALLDRLGRVNVVGEAFTVYKLGRDLDVSLPRRERKTGRGHRAFYIEGDPSMSFEEAARRRDFTVNAVLEDPLTGELIDPFGGRADIERKLLRAVSPETFVEDSLRVLRAAQFAARSTRRESSTKVSGETARRSFLSMSARPPNGSISSPASGSSRTALTVKSGRRAAHSKG